MAEVRWIKIVTDVFDDEKVLLIESLPDADAIIVIWFKLLCLAGKQNNSGVFIMNNKIPYTDKMLATIFRRKEATVQLALKTFEQFGMIEIVDGVITIPNWGKHQNLDKIEKNNEYMREYMKKYREKQKQISGKTNDKVNCKTNSKSNVSALEKNREEKNRKEKNREEENRDIVSLSPSVKINFDLYSDIYNTYCFNLSKVKTITEKRKTAIRKFAKEFSLDDFKDICINANNSSFLIGHNDRGWKADFDFLLRTDKAVAILEGKFNDYKTEKPKSKLDAALYEYRIQQEREKNIVDMGDLK